MKTGRFLINPASAIVSGLLLALPLLALAQVDASSIGNRVSKPVCVYKAVMSDAEIDRVAGFGAHEVRTWVAAAAAVQRMGRTQPELRYYHLVPEWITGMGIVVGQA